MRLHAFRIDPTRGGERVARLPFLRHGAVNVKLTSALTFIIGENGSGKTTLLEAVAARCGIRPNGGKTYAEYEDRDTTALSQAVDVQFSHQRNQTTGLFLRADTFPAMMQAAGKVQMVTSDEWRDATEQSRGEGVLALLMAKIDASERMLFILDEPETGLSIERQLALLYLLHDIHRDGRSQALIATHSPILMSHPGSQRFWIDEDGINPRDLIDIPHYRVMNRFMRDPIGRDRYFMDDNPRENP